MARSKKIEVYYNRTSRTLYVMTPDGQSYFVTNSGQVGKTVGTKHVVVGNRGTGGMYENASLVCELTPSVIRKLAKVLK